jgi:hypothetical protein
MLINLNNYASCVHNTARRKGGGNVKSFFYLFYLYEEVLGASAKNNSPNTSAPYERSIKSPIPFETYEY